MLTHAATSLDGELTRVSYHADDQLLCVQYRQAGVGNDADDMYTEDNVEAFVYVDGETETIHVESDDNLTDFQLDEFCGHITRLYSVLQGESKSLDLVEEP